MVHLRILVFIIGILASSSVCGLCQEDSIKIINKRISFKGQLLKKELLDTIGIAYIGKKEPFEIYHIIVWGLGKPKVRNKSSTFNFFYASTYIRADAYVNKKKHGQYYFVDGRLMEINEQEVHYEPAIILQLARDFYKRGMTLLKPN